MISGGPTHELSSLGLPSVSVELMRGVWNGLCSSVLKLRKSESIDPNEWLIRCLKSRDESLIEEYFKHLNGLNASLPMAVNAFNAFNV